MARRQHLTLTLLGVMLFLSLLYIMSSSSSSQYPTRFGSDYTPQQQHDAVHHEHEHDHAGDTGSAGSGLGTSFVPESILHGGAIAPKLPNATARAELGRASWKLLHTMMARFPEHPTPDDQLALKTYIQLFARLYPCGDCAAHFQKLLAKYPPQTSSRNAAAGWACFVHNEVNKRLHKQEFDCSKLGDFYDCGCGEEPVEGQKKGGELKRD